MPRVVAICGDPGGANAVAPVIEALRSEGRVTVDALAYQQAKDTWTRRGLDCQELVAPWTDGSIVRHLREKGTALLLAGTSFNPIGLEKRFTTRARCMGLQSLAVLDFWSNYAVRFSNYGRDLACIPDRIAVMDDWATREMQEEGFDLTRLVVTGQPAHDDLAQWRTQFSTETQECRRRELGVENGSLLVMFASQPLASLFGVDPSNALFPGYTEHTVIPELVRALERIAGRSGRDISLVIRPHPRESSDAYNHVRSEEIRIVVDTKDESRTLAMSSDLVAGMNTVLLVEACYLGCITVSLQPGLRVTDTLPTNRLGLSYPAYSNEEVEPVLEKMLLDKAARSEATAKLAEMQLDSLATQRVTRLVYRMIGLEPQQEN